MLYYKLKIDIIARYFSEYPASSLSDLAPFQEELRRHDAKVKEERLNKIASKNKTDLNGVKDSTLLSDNLELQRRREMRGEQSPQA